MMYLTVEEVLYIHFRAIDRFGGLHGLRDIGGLESAVLRPQTTVFGQDAYPALHEKVAAMVHSLALNHPFYDGNKRTAFVAMGLFLRLNGFILIGTHQEIENFTVRVAEEHLSVESIAHWLTKHTRSLQS